jgi:hypothetical protein
MFWHSGAPLTVIYEAFSPALEKYLGPTVYRSLDDVDQGGLQREA